MLTALDTNGAIYKTVLPSLAAIEPVLEGRIAAGSVRCSDGAAAYVRAAVKAGAEHRRVIVPTIIAHEIKANPVPVRPRKPGRLRLGRVNAHHGQIKVLVNGKCRGVATRYLDNCLDLHRAMCRRGFEDNVLLDIALG